MDRTIVYDKTDLRLWAVVVVNWSACSLYTPTIRVQFSLSTTLLVVNSNVTKYKLRSNRLQSPIKTFLSSGRSVKILFFLKNGPTPASFCLFLFFSITILQKNCRPQRDSNSDRQSRRRAR